MKIDKSMILDFMKQQHHDQGQIEQADKELPEQVDTEGDKGKLEKYGIDFNKLVGFLPDNVATSLRDFGTKFGL